VSTALPERFWAKVEKLPDAPGCWVWTGALNEQGYAVFNVTHLDQRRAHRLTFEDLRGPIPTDKQPDHLCRLRCCINPWHTEPVTSRVNTLRGEGPSARNARKVACPQGHPYSGIKAGNKRTCRVCINEQDRARYRRQRAVPGLRGGE
jgi:hypothetical protein